MIASAPSLIAVPLWVVLRRPSKSSAPSYMRPRPLQNKLSTWQHFKLISQDTQLLAESRPAFPDFSAFEEPGRTTANTCSFVPLHKQGMNITRFAVGGEPDRGPLGVAAKIASGWFYDQTSIRVIRFFYPCWPSRPA